MEYCPVQTFIKKNLPNPWIITCLANLPKHTHTDTRGSSQLTAAWVTQPYPMKCLIRKAFLKCFIWKEKLKNRNDENWVLITVWRNEMRWMSIYKSENVSVWNKTLFRRGHNFPFIQTRMQNLEKKCLEKFEVTRFLFTAPKKIFGFDLLLRIT